MNYNIVNSFLSETETKLNNSSNNLDYILSNINKINKDIINLLNIYEKDNKNIDMNDINNMNILFDRINIDISKYNVDINKNENINEDIINKLETFVNNNVNAFKIRPKIKKNEQIITSKYKINKEKINEIKSKIQIIKKYISDIILQQRNDINDIKKNDIKFTDIDKTINNFRMNLDEQKKNYQNIKFDINNMNNKIDMNNRMIKDVAINVSNQIDYLYDKFKKYEEKYDDINTLKKNVIRLYNHNKIYK